MRLKYSKAKATTIFISRLNFLFEFVMKKAAHEIVIESPVARSAKQPESANARETSRIQILIYG